MLQKVIWVTQLPPFPPPKHSSLASHIVLFHGGHHAIQERANPRLRIWLTWCDNFSIDAYINRV